MGRVCQCYSGCNSLLSGSTGTSDGTAAAICVVHYKKELLLLDHYFMILLSLFLKSYNMPARVYCSYFVSRIRMQAFDDSTILQ